MIHVATLLACAVTIYLACDWFINAIEWLGVELKVGPLAVGTLLAAAGTALPESIVTLVAAVFGSPTRGDDIAVGAAMGGPLVVGTIAYGVTGAMLLWRRRRRHRTAPRAGAAPGATGTAHDTCSGGPDPDQSAGVDADGPVVGVDTAALARDQRWFLTIFIFQDALGLVTFTLKAWLGLLFFGAFALYVRREMSPAAQQASGKGLEPLKLQPRRARPSRTAVLVQVFVTLGLVFGASQLFVAQLEWAGPALGLPAVVVALLVSPVATELPEVMNAIIWVRAGKTQLALANISGAMMIQATVASGIGILLTPWRFDTPLILAAVTTVMSVTYLLWLLSRRKFTPARLSLAAGFYVIFAAALVLAH